MIFDDIANRESFAEIHRASIEMAAQLVAVKMVLCERGLTTAEHLEQLTKEAAVELRKQIAPRV